MYLTSLGTRLIAGATSKHQGEVNDPERNEQSCHIGRHV